MMASTSLNTLFKIIALSCLLLLAACTDSDKATMHAPELSPELSQLYQRTCKNCHEVSGTTAPQTGDQAAWAQVMEQGMETVVAHAMNGYKGMPPAGQCFECSEDDIRLFIQYMAWK